MEPMAEEWPGQVGRASQHIMFPPLSLWKQKPPCQGRKDLWEKGNNRSAGSPRREVPKDTKLCRRALTHSAVGGQGLVGQYHLEWGQEDQDGCLSICSKPSQGLSGSQDRRIMRKEPAIPHPSHRHLHF